MTLGGVAGSAVPSARVGPVQEIPGVFEIQVVVDDEALDDNGHVNNVRYVQWMQDVAWAHSLAADWPAERYAEQSIAWVVRAHRIRYLRPARLGDTLRVWTWVRRFGKATAERGFRFLDAASSARLAEAETDWALVGADGRPRAIPPALLGAFDVVGELD